MMQSFDLEASLENILFNENLANYCMALNISKSCGPDSFHSRQFKEIAHEIALL